MRDGVVLSCVRDDLWGWHVAVRQTDGAICTYSGLSCVLVQAGQSVVRGQPLGDVMAAVLAESELGAHLHLSSIGTARRPNPRCPIDLFSNFTHSSKRTFEIHRMMVY